MLNNVLQTNILAKANLLKSPEDVVKHSEAFEIAIHDQQALQNNTNDNVMAARISDYKKQKNQPPKKPCSGYGSHYHQSFECSHACPAWGKTCLNCSTRNHFANVCRHPKKSESVDALTVQVTHQNIQPKSISAINNDTVTKIPAQLMFPSANTQSTFTPKSVLIFPDSGASIFIAGTQHLPEFDIDDCNLLQCNKTISPIGGSKLTCWGWTHTKFTVDSNTTLQPCYICDKVYKIYLSQKGCTDTNILPNCSHVQCQLIQLFHPYQQRALRSVSLTEHYHIDVINYHTHPLLRT